MLLPFCFVVAVQSASNGLANAEVLIIRHAERPDLQDALTEKGHARAKAYADYFQHLTIDGRKIRLTHIIAEQSNRTRETVGPLSKASGLPLDTRFATKQQDAMVADLEAHSYGGEILICWHHHAIPKLIDAFGGNAEALIPKGKWPGSTYDWIIDLRFDAQGKLSTAGEKLVHEHLMPGDSAS